MSRLRRLADDITGPHSLQLASLALSIPGAILFSVVSTIAIHARVDIFALLLANLVGFLFCLPIYLILDNTLYLDRQTRKVKLWAVPLAIVGFGCTKGFFTGISYWLLRPDLTAFPQDVVSRMIQSTSVAALTLPLVATLTAALFQFRAEREALILEQVRVELKSDQALISNAGKAELNKLRSALAPVLQALRTAQNSGDVALRQLLSLKLRETIESVVRPASQRIWSANLHPVREFNVPQLTRLALQKHSLDPITVPVLFIAFFMPNRVLVLGIVNAILIAGLVFLVTAGVFWLTKKIPSKSTAALVLRFLGALAAANLLADSLAVLLLGPAFQLSTEVQVFSGALLLLNVAVVMGLIGAALEIRSDVIEGFAQLTGEEPDQVGMALGRRMLANRKLAQFLHGQVQNKMLSVALRLDSYDAASPYDLTLQLDELEKMLLGVDSTETAVGQQTLEQIFAVAKESWLGFLDLEISQSGSSLKVLSQSATDSVAQIIHEAIGNAWRHGKATEMKILIAKTKRQLKLTAKDNGVGPLNGQKGLGSALYDSVAGSAWRLEKRVGSGTTLTLVVSLDSDGDS